MRCHVGRANVCSSMELMWVHAAALLFLHNYIAAAARARLCFLFSC